MIPGQLRFYVLGFRVSTTHPILLIGLFLGVLAAVAWAGRRQLRRHASWAALLAVVAFLVGVQWGSTVAGGADSYGSLSQAGMWLQGQLFVQEDVVHESAWPQAIDTWTPLAFRPSAMRPDAVVPQYPPGLPLLMALFQWVFGYCAAFVLVPLASAAAVALTYVLGRQTFEQPRIALWGALLVASSPVFLFQSMNPMTDVPVTAAWTLALVLTVAGWPMLTGLAIAAALLIRPNLILVAVVFFAWFALRDWKSAVRLAIGVLPAVVVIAWINNTLFGSPLTSGYGSLDYLYSWRHIATNVKQFAGWMTAAETPFVACGVLAFMAPARVPRLRLLFICVMAAVVASYLLYAPFDAWWYLRFLLPLWPPMMLLAAAGADAIICAAARRGRGLVVTLAALALAIHGLRFATSHGVFDFSRGERKYVDVARFVAANTDARAVFVSVQHSGTIRMYADRLTLRWDALDPLWLDRAVESLAAGGRHPYVLLDAAEIPAFKARFAPASPLGALDWPPAAELASPSVVMFDPLERRRTAPPAIIVSSGDGSAGWRCDVPQTWPPVLRMK